MRLNSWPCNQESHTFLTEPAGHPQSCWFLCFHFSISLWAKHTWALRTFSFCVWKLQKGDALHVWIAHISVLVVYCCIESHLKMWWFKATLSWIRNSGAALLVGSDLGSIMRLLSDASGLPHSRVWCLCHEVSKSWGWNSWNSLGSSLRYLFVGFPQGLSSTQLQGSQTSKPSSSKREEEHQTEAELPLKI